MSYSELKTPAATFRLLHRLEGKRVFVRDWPQKAEAILVEMVQSPPIENSDKRIEAYVAELENNPGLQDLVRKIKKDQIRVCFGDLAESKSLSTLRVLDLMVIEFLAGLVILGTGIGFFFKKSVEKKEQRRGLFFRSLGLIAAGLWLLSSVVEILGIFLVKTVGNTAKKGPLKAIRESIAQASNLHPEKTVVFLRNLVLTEKAWEVADLMTKNNSLPVIVLDFHFGHAGILKMLKWKPATRRTLLHLYRPFIKDILSDSVRRDYLARLIVIKWDGIKWQIERNYLVDSLENL